MTTHTDRSAQSLKKEKKKKPKTFTCSQLKLNMGLQDECHTHTRQETGDESL